jgi:lipoprotein NlpI
MRSLLLAPLLAACAFAPRAVAAPADDHLRDAQKAYAKRDWDGAVKHAGKALAADAKLADAYHLRGAAQFMRSDFAASVADFDRYLALRPAARAGHWQRGISLYYAGKYDEGRKQFEGYEKVDTNDVENAVWHFLCVARKDGVAKARAGLLKIGKDKRVPMMQVYGLFKGDLKPADVEAAARGAAGGGSPEEGKRAWFYAHLYLGLYFDATGDKKKALHHLRQADEAYRIAHYMGDVARVHHALLRKELKGK